MKVVANQSFFYEIQGCEILKHLHRLNAFSLLELLMTLINLVHLNGNEWFHINIKSINRIIHEHSYYSFF